jgi:hypothetical protein
MIKLKAILLIITSKYFYVAGSKKGTRNTNIETIGHYTTDMAFHISMGMIENGVELVKEESALKEAKEILNL